MAADEEHSQKTPLWNTPVEKFEDGVIAVLTSLLVIVISIILAVIIYLFAINVADTVATVESVSDIQDAALDAFSGILLILLGLELLETVKVYYREHSVRVEVILLVGLIAMGRHVLQVDLHHTEPWTMLGFSTLILVLAVSYFLIKRTQIPIMRPGKDAGAVSD